MPRRRSLLQMKIYPVPPSAPHSFCSFQAQFSLRSCLATWTATACSVVPTRRPSSWR